MTGMGGLLACAVLAPVLALATDVLAWRRWRTYSPIRQSISELIAIGAPTRRTVLPLTIASDVLLAAGGTGIAGSPPGAPGLRLAGRLVSASAVLDAAAATLLPRATDQATWSRRNTANTVVMAASVGCTVGAMAAGASALRGPVRAVSVGILLAFLGLTPIGVIAGRRATAPVPQATGAQERTMAYAFRAWIALVAITRIACLRREGSRSVASA